MLLLKLLIVPAFLLAISLAARRFGPQIVGLLAGFPVVAGPILLFLSIENGARYAATAAQGALLAVVACVAFGLVYARACQRFAWPTAVALGHTSWLAAAFALSLLPPDLGIATALTFGVLLWAPALLPVSTTPVAMVRVMPVTELLARMCAGASLVLGVTGVSAIVGTRWAGLLAMFPVMGTVLGVYALRGNGPAYVAHLFRGMFRGFYAFATFCVTLALLIDQLPRAAAFVLAVLLALLAQGVVQWLQTRPALTRSRAHLPPP